MASVSETFAFSIACASCRAVSDANAAPMASRDDPASSKAALTGPDWVFICAYLLVALTQTATLARRRGSGQPRRTTPRSVYPRITCRMLHGRHAPGTVARWLEERI